MKDAEFREWLEARRWNGKPITSVSTRMTRARRFEKAMPALGLGSGDLDVAFEADAMDALTQWLREACKQADKTGSAPEALVGTSAKPAMQMRNVAGAVRNYRQFRSAPPVSAWPALEELRSAFLDRVPEFESFAQTDNSYERIERTYKDAMAVAVQTIAASDADDEQAGRQIYRALIPSKGPLLGWQTDDDFTRKYVEQAPAFYATIGRLARDDRPVAVAIMAAVERLAALRERGAGTLTPGVVAAITLTVAGMVHPDSAAPFKITKGRELAKLLTGDPIFHGNVLTSDQIDAWLGLLGRIERVMRDEWGWAPRDLIDVQGFAWVALDEGWLQDEEEMDDAAVLARFAGNPHFRAVQARWTSEQTSAFCTIARAIQTAGFDWYHVDLARNPARFGRKPDRTKPAAAVQGYLEAAGVPRIWFNDTKSSLRFGINDVPLDETSATRFVEVLFEKAEDVAAWKAPQPPRPGLWPDEAGTDRQEDTPIWIVTARNGEADGLAQFVERGEWHLLHDLGGRMNDLVREMQPGDRIVLRDFLSQKHNLPFDARGQRVTALRIRATGVVTEQRDDGLGVGVDWTVLPKPRTWYFYTKNYPVWRLRLDVEMARMLAAFIFEDAPQDYDWFTARWFGSGVSSEEQSMMPDPTNLILYGPPGTGKTYATAAQAVMLCDGLAADDLLFGETERDALMERYRELAKDERIEFVTFHQSMAYEEFVEGMRPSSVDEDGQPLVAGFRLAPTPGILRTIAHRAELSTGPADEAFTLGDRQVFKMSIGDATKAAPVHYSDTDSR